MADFHTTLTHKTCRSCSRRRLFCRHIKKSRPLQRLASGSPVVSASMVVQYLGLEVLTLHFHLSCFLSKLSLLESQLLVSLAVETESLRIHVGQESMWNSFYVHEHEILYILVHSCVINFI